MQGASLRSAGDSAVSVSSLAVPTVPRPRRVVIVDDSLSMRRWLSGVIDRDPRLDVVGLAATAEEARATIKLTAPDVVTLDLDMPGMDGLAFLERLMRLRPMPVVVLSGTLDPNGARALRATEIGAVACIEKPSFPTPVTLTTLCDRLVDAADGVSGVQEMAEVSDVAARLTGQIMLVGASTGGVTAIEGLLTSLPVAGPPVVIAQHMPQSFLLGFVRRLDEHFDRHVWMASHGTALRPGDVAVAPAEGPQTGVVFDAVNGWRLSVAPHPEATQYTPSVDELFRSAVPWGDRVGAAVLTGLGKDGASAAELLRRAGARTIGQSRESCVVYGMPAAARRLGATELEADIGDLGPTLLQMMADRDGAAS